MHAVQLLENLKNTISVESEILDELQDVTKCNKMEKGGKKDENKGERKRRDTDIEHQGQVWNDDWIVTQLFHSFFQWLLNKNRANHFIYVDRDDSFRTCQG